jgi:hypothetical protein
VTATAARNGGAPASGVALYSIGYGKIDASVLPRIVARGDSTAVWIHSARRVRVGFTYAFAGQTTSGEVQGVTGKDGWVSLPLAIPVSARSGKGTIDAFAEVKGKTFRTRTTFTIT